MPGGLRKAYPRDCRRLAGERTAICARASALQVQTSQKLPMVIPTDELRQFEANWARAINGIVRVSGQAIDWGYVEGWAGQFSEVPGQEDVIRALDDVMPRDSGATGL